MPRLRASRISLAVLVTACLVLPLTQARAFQAPDLRQVPLNALPKAGKRALVIGIDRYASGEAHSGGVGSARQFVTLLKTKLAFPESSIVYLRDDGDAEHTPTLAHILKALDDFVDHTGDQSSVVVYVSGRGLRYRDHDWLVPSDGNPKDPTGTCISLTHFTAALEGNNLARLLALYDIGREVLPYDGAAGDPVVRRYGSQDAPAVPIRKGTVAKPGLAYLYACGAGEKNWSGKPEEFKGSVFSQMALKALDGDPLAADPVTGNTTFKWFRSYVLNRVSGYVQRSFGAMQVPDVWTTDEKMLLLKP